jgi:hypothetical protein
MWAPPKNTKVMVRDYILGWGKGIPDEYVERLDGKQRFFVIKQLGKYTFSKNQKVKNLLLAASSVIFF